MRTAALCFLALFPLSAETTEAVLARIDQEAASFRQMTASVRKISYTAVLNDTSEESGTTWMKRSGRAIEMRTEITQPEPRSIGFSDTKLQIYLPKIRTVQIYDLRRYRGMVDQFLVLGFGSSGKEIEKNFTVQAAGEETVDGRQTTRLELIPRSKDVLEQFRKIELWIPVDAGHPVRQRLLQPGGDYYLVAYSGIKLNPGLADDSFRLKLPAGVKEEYPQK